MNYMNISTISKKFLAIALVAGVFIAPSTTLARTLANELAPSVQPLAVSTLPPTGVQETSATLNGTYQTITATSAIVWFQYGTSASALNQVTQPMSKPQGTGQFSKSLSTLSAGTTYYYKAYASFNGTTVPASATVSFTTQGGTSTSNQIATLPPTQITTTSAVLNAYVNVRTIGTYTLVFKWGASDSTLNNTLTYGIVSGQAGQKSISLTGLTPANSYAYKACIRDANGTDQCGSTQVTFTTLDSNPTTYECNDGVDNDGDGRTDYPADQGCTSSSDNSENSDGNPCTNCGGNNSEPSVTTLSADDIEEDEALLQGEADPNGDALTSVWFEYGEDEDDLDETVYVSSSNYDDNEDTDTVDFDKKITGLDNDTRYYFRACAENSEGEDCGSIRSFTTDDNNNDNNDDDSNDDYVHESPQIIPRIIYKTTTVGSTSSKVMLSIDTRFDNAYQGDTIDYVVEYKNISGSTLTNSILHIEFPKEVTFRRANEGRYNEKDHTLTLDLGTLSRGEHDEITISVRADSSIKSRSEIVTKATLAFTMPNSAQDNAIAYAITKVSGGNSVSGNALAGTALFGGNGFLPDSLIEWLILTILIIVIIGGFRYYKHKQV